MMTGKRSQSAAWAIGLEPVFRVESVVNRHQLPLTPKALVQRRSHHLCGDWGNFRDKTVWKRILPIRLPTGARNEAGAKRRIRLAHYATQRRLSLRTITRHSRQRNSRASQASRWTGSASKNSLEKMIPLTPRSLIRNRANIRRSTETFACHELNVVSCHARRRAGERFNDAILQPAGKQIGTAAREPIQNIGGQPTIVSARYASTT